MIGLEIRKLSEEEKIDVICIQEPYVLKGKLTNIPSSAQVVLGKENSKAAIINLNKN